jgi:hypothetical protein
MRDRRRREMAAEVAAHLHAGASIQPGKWFIEQKQPE